MYNVQLDWFIRLLETERAALNAGTVGFDRNIFSGNPSVNDLKGYAPKLTEEEQRKELVFLLKLLFYGGLCHRFPG